MLPMLAFAALYFLDYKTHRRITQSILCDFLLMLSCIGLFMAGNNSVYSSITF